MKEQINTIKNLLLWKLSSCSHFIQQSLNSHKHFTLYIINNEVYDEITHIHHLMHEQTALSSGFGKGSEGLASTGGSTRPAISSMFFRVSCSKKREEATVNEKGMWHVTHKMRYKHNTAESDHILCQNHPKLGRARCELAASEALPLSSAVEELFPAAGRYRIQKRLS